MGGAVDKRAHIGIWSEAHQRYVSWGASLEEVLQTWRSRAYQHPFETMVMVVSQGGGCENTRVLVEELGYGKELIKQLLQELETLEQAGHGDYAVSRFL